MVRSFKLWAAAAVVSLGFAGHAAAQVNLDDESTNYIGFFTGQADLAVGINTLTPLPPGSFSPDGSLLRSMNQVCTSCPLATNDGMVILPVSVTGGLVQPLDEEFKYVVGLYGDPGNGEDPRDPSLDHFNVWFVGGLSGPEGVMLDDFAEFFGGVDQAPIGLDLVSVSLFAVVGANGVPEPASLALVALGLLAAAGTARRRRR